MTFWKVSRKTTAAQTTNAASPEEDSLSELTTLEIVMIVLTVLAFIGQFLNLGIGLMDHFTLNKLAKQFK